MPDIKLKSEATLRDGVTMDWLLTPVGDLDQTEELATTVRVALGTDALANISEVLPDPDAVDRRGWWGNLDAESIWDGWPIGTKCWLLSRAKIVDQNAWEGDTVQRAREYCYVALKPLIDRRIASSIDVVAARVGLERIDVIITIWRGPLREIVLRYQYLWQAP